MTWGLCICLAHWHLELVGEGWVNPFNPTEGQHDIQVTTVLPSPSFLSYPFIDREEGRMNSCVGCAPTSGIESRPIDS